MKCGKFGPPKPDPKVRRAQAIQTAQAQLACEKPSACGRCAVIDALRELLACA